MTKVLNYAVVLFGTLLAGSVSGKPMAHVLTGALSMERHLQIPPPDPKFRLKRRRQARDTALEENLPETWLDDIPASFDARLAWPVCPSIRHIRDQGSCGICFAAAFAGVLSDRLCISDFENYAQDPFTGSISMNQVAACHAPDQSDTENCDGGSTPWAVLPFLALHGAVTGGDYNSSALESCVPYPEDPDLVTKLTCAKECKSKGYKKTFEKDKRTTDYYWIKDLDGDYMSRQQIASVVKMMQRDIMAYGPIAAGIALPRDYHDKKYLEHNYTITTDGVYTRAHSNGLYTNHRVRIVGWGEHNVTGAPYWIVANSWGKAFGTDGFMWIERGQNTMGIESFVGAPVINPEQSMSRSEFCDADNFWIDQAVSTSYKDPSSPLYITKGEFIMRARLDLNAGKIQVVVPREEEPAMTRSRLVFADRAQTFENEYYRDGFWMLSDDLRREKYCVQAFNGSLKYGCLTGPAVHAPDSHISHVCGPDGDYGEITSRVCWAYVNSKPDRMIWLGEDVTFIGSARTHRDIGSMLTDVFKSVEAMLYVRNQRIAVIGTTAEGTQFVGFMNFLTTPDSSDDAEDSFKMEMTDGKVNLVPVSEFVVC